MKLLETDDRCPSQHEAWTHIRALLPTDRELERWAREKGALRRRRGVEAATALLRVLLSYACCTLSLRGASEWAQDSAWARMNKSALRGRLLKSTPWLEHLLAHLVARPSAHPPLLAGLHVVLADGTRVTPPGVRGSGWCVHTLFEPWTAQTVGLQLTDRTGAEHLGRFELESNQLVVADAGFAHRRGLKAVADRKAFFLVRTNWCNLPLETRHGRPFDLFTALGELQVGQCGAFEVQTRPDKANGLPAIPVRLVAYRKSEEAARAAQRKAEAEARRKKRKVDPRTLVACQYVLLVTNVPKAKLSSEELLDLYRLRWQIELSFKRWKSLLELDRLNVRHPDSIRATLTAKLLGALLVERLVAKREAGEATWTCTQRIARAVQQALLGEQAISAILRQHSPLRQPNESGSRERQRPATQKRLAHKLESRERQAFAA